MSDADVHLQEMWIHIVETDDHPYQRDDEDGSMSAMQMLRSGV